MFPNTVHVTLCAKRQWLADNNSVTFHVVLLVWSRKNESQLILYEGAA